MPERGAGSPPRPLRRPHPRRNLVDRLARHIERADGRGPDWPLEVRLACARQDMEWELDYWDRASEARLAHRTLSERETST